jgi:hypothetical protein
VNRNEIKAAVESFLHRSIADTDANAWFALAEAVLFRELKTAANETRATLVVPGFPFALPPDFRNMRLLSFAGTAINYVAPRKIGSYQTNGASRPYWWTVTGRTLEARPWVAGDYEAVYWGALPPLTAGTDSNGISIEHPDAYVWAVLAQAYQWEQDVEAHSAMVARLAAVVEMANGASAGDRWGV